MDRGRDLLATLRKLIEDAHRGRSLCRHVRRSATTRVRGTVRSVGLAAVFGPLVSACTSNTGSSEGEKCSPREFEGAPPDALQTPEWPFSPVDYPDTVPLEHGTCSAVGVWPAPDQRTETSHLTLQLNCLHGDGSEHTVNVGADYDAVGDGLDYLKGRDGLRLAFQTSSTWTFEGGREDNFTIRDGDGTLLIAGTTVTPPVEDGLELGTPVNWGNGSAAWYEPFQRFVLRDPACPRETSDDGRRRRLAVEAETESGTFVVLDHTAQRDIELAEGTYDFIVGEAYTGEVKTSEHDSMKQTWIAFAVIRHDDGTPPDDATTTGTSADTTTATSTSADTNTSNASTSTTPTNTSSSSATETPSPSG